MSGRIHRRDFARAGTLATLGIASQGAASAASPTGVASAGAAGGFAALEVRPYQLMCIVCRIGEGRTRDLGDARLTEILSAVRKDRRVPVRLRCNVDTVYRYQNPGHGEDTPEGELFNAKRDLDVVQRLGLVPGDARPAVDMFERLLDSIPSAQGICGYAAATADTWRGCARAKSGNYEKGRALGIRAILPPRDPQEKAAAKKASAAAIYEAKTLQIRPHHLMCMSCFFGGAAKLAPLVEDNLFEAVEVIRTNPATPVTLIAGPCMICPPCSHYDPASNLCLGGRSMALRDQKKDLDVLQKLGLKYGDTLPARELFARLYERIASTREICGYGDGEVRAREWSICGNPAGREEYRKARAANLGIGKPGAS